jgi:hypothetical protein
LISRTVGDNCLKAGLSHELPGPLVAPVELAFGKNRFSHLSVPFRLAFTAYFLRSALSALGISARREAYRPAFPLWILIQTRIETKCYANGQQAVASISALRTKYKVGGAKVAASDQVANSSTSDFVGRVLGMSLQDAAARRERGQRALRDAVGLDGSHEFVDHCVP